MKRRLCSIGFLIAALASCLSVAGTWSTRRPIRCRRGMTAHRRRRSSAFVEKVTKEGSPDFVKPEERIATFDNDGTLWAEQPMYFQVMFAFDRIKAMAPQHPEWKETEPFKSVSPAT